MTETRLIDCRWLSYTGKGRVTDYLLQGLHELSPPGRWILWGPPQTEAFLWPGARVALSRRSPLNLAGQREALSVPRADVSLFLHAVRPLHVRQSLVLVHDTIPIRWGGNRRRQALWKMYLTISARNARGTFVYSDATWRRVEEDLGVTPVGRVHLPTDQARWDRVRARRARSDSPGDTMLYVGLIRPQKNLDRAIAAFHGSSFEQGGGRFVIVGGDEASRQATRQLAASLGADNVECRAPCSDDELDDLYCAAAFLIQPSLEEGYGLPVVEALSAGIPVCCSAIDSLLEASRGLAETFDPRLVQAIREAIDRTHAEVARGFTPEFVVSPTPAEFAKEVLSLPW